MGWFSEFREKVAFAEVSLLVRMRFPNYLVYEMYGDYAIEPLIHCYHNGPKVQKQYVALVLEQFLPLLSSYCANEDWKKANVALMVLANVGGLTNKYGYKGDSGLTMGHGLSVLFSTSPESAAVIFSQVSKKISYDALKALMETLFKCVCHRAFTYPENIRTRELPEVLALQQTFVRNQEKTLHILLDFLDSNDKTMQLLVMDTLKKIAATEKLPESLVPQLVRRCKIFTEQFSFMVEDRSSTKFAADLLAAMGVPEPKDFFELWFNNHNPEKLPSPVELRKRLTAYVNFLIRIGEEQKTISGVMQVCTSMYDRKVKSLNQHAAIVELGTTFGDFPERRREVWFRQRPVQRRAFA